MKPWIPTFAYAGPTVLTLEQPMRPFRYSQARTIGGHARSASDQLATYTVRRSRDLPLRLRVMESERAAVTAMLEVLQDASTKDVTVTLDTYGVIQTPGTTYACEIVHPQAGEDIDSLYQRSEEYLPMFDIDIAVRKTDGTAWDLQWLPES